MTNPDEPIDEPPEDHAEAEADAARGGRRIAAIDALRGSLTEVYDQPDYLADLRADWPT